MKPTDIYMPEVTVKSVSMFGNGEFKEDISNSTIPIIKAFWEDLDLQELIITSSNIGFVYTYQKAYKPMESKEDAEFAASLKA